MDFLSYIKKRTQIIKNGFFVDVQTPDLKQKINYALFNIPKNMVRGAEIIERVFEPERINSNEIIVNSAMSAFDIKKEIGKFVFNKKRWDKQEEISTKLISDNKIELKLFYDAYNTTDYLETYLYINADVFAIAYGNNLSIDEIALSITNLYLKKQSDQAAKKQMNNFVDSLFDNKVE